MSPGVRGGCCFVIDLEDMASAVIFAVLMRSPTAPGFLQGGGGVASDADLAQPYGPSAVEVLADQDATVGIGSAVGSRGDIDDQTAEADRVVVGHGGFISEADQEVAIGGLDLAEG